MTTSDKTGDKLVASIRKTKESAAQQESPATTTAPAATPTTGKRAAPKARAKVTAKKAPVKKTVAKPQERDSDRGNFQSVDRVWPD